MITTTSFEELVAEHNEKGTKLVTGFDPKTLLRFVARTCKTKFDYGSGNTYNASVIVQHFENTDVSITASMPRLVPTWEPVIVPGLVLHGTTFFKGKLLKDQDGKNVPVCNLPQGAFIEHDGKFMQIPSDNRHVLLKGDATLTDLINEFPQTALAIPDREERKLSRSKITNEFGSIKAEVLINAFDPKELITANRLYDFCYDVKDCMAKNLDVTTAINSAFGRLAIASHEGWVNHTKLTAIGEESGIENARNFANNVQRIGPIICGKLVGTETKPRYIDYFTATEKPKK